MKNRIDSSRQKTPWDNNDNINELEKFIRDKYKREYITKHPKLSETDESNIINSFLPTGCKYCGTKNIVKKGKTKNGVQMYYCKGCKKRFTPIKNTIFENHKISISEWIDFLLDLFNYSSTTLTSKVNKNSLNTSIYWLHKVFLVLDHWQDTIKLSGDVYIDEMFYSVIKSDIKFKDGRKLRGISKNKYCIGIGYDKKNIIASVECLGKPTYETTKATFINHIASESKLVHDDEKSHNILISKLNLKSESYSSLLLKEKKDEENPLRPINHQCDLIKQFLNAHSGFDREDLQGYLNLYCFMNSGHQNKLTKVYEFMKLAMNTNINLKYRDLFKKN